jgi:hypothetical protein
VAAILFDSDGDGILPMILDAADCKYMLQLLIRCNKIELDEHKLQELVFNTLYSYGSASQPHWKSQQSSHHSYSSSSSCKMTNSFIRPEVLLIAEQGAGAAFGVSHPVWYYTMNVVQVQKMFADFPQLLTLFTRDLYDCFGMCQLEIF